MTEQTRDDRGFGPCAKRHVVCTIVLRDGRRFTGENLCRNPQAVCPRVHGDDYTKCQTICDQTGHAEINAIFAAVANTDSNDEIAGGHAYLQGHWRVCDDCRASLASFGITNVYLGAPPR